ncbi:MAG TPA: hypothetical protein VKU62_12780 [Thermoanaerobaculia bacterium]|nr:hypothetical protein [Thermoanaerobaculia bacterium]
MAEEKNEPQSYGSQSEWVRGDVGEEVNRLKGNPNSQRSEFYESRREEEQADSVSPEQLADSDQPSSHADEDDTLPVQKVEAEESGAKRDGYFKRRDYE